LTAREQFSKSATVEVQLNVQGINSVKRFYKKEDVELYVPLLSAVVNLDQGNVTSVVWDDTCAQCDDADCVDGKACGTSSSSCGGECDIRIYLVWSGKDANGEYSTSRSFMPSRFQAFAVNPVYKAASDLTDEHYV
jgi:hypothetical protein